MQCFIESGLGVLGLHDSDPPQSLGGLGLGLELGLLALEDVDSHEVVVVELHELFLLGLDLLQRAFVALGLVLDKASAAGELVSQLGSYLRHDFG